MANEVELKKESNVIPFDASLLLEDAGSASDNMTADDMLIPRLRILQSGSPVVKKSDGAYVKGAEEGMIFDNVSNQLFSGETGITVVPVSYRRTFIEWTDDRKFVADHGINCTALLEKSTDDGRGGFDGSTYGGNLTTPYVPERVALPVDPAFMAGFMPEQTYFGSMNPSATELQNPFGTPETPYTQGTGVDDSGVGATGPVQIPATPFNPTMMPSYQQFYGSAAQGVPQVQDPNMPLEQFAVQPFVPPVVDDGEGSSDGDDNGGDDGGSGGGDNGGSGGGDDGGGSGGNIGGGIPGIKGSRAIIPEAPFMPDYFNQEAIARMNRESMMQPMQNGGDTNIDIDKLPNEGLKKLAQEAPEVVEKMAAKTDKFQGGGGTPLEDASMSMSDILNDPLTQQVIAFIRGDVADDRVVNQFIEKYGISEFVNLRNSILQSIQPDSQTEGMINSNSGDGMSDNIGGVIGDPSRNGERVAVSQDEFIVPADVVSMIGNGSSDAGAKELYSMMDRVRQESIGKQEQINQQEMSADLSICIFLELICICIL